MNTEIITLVLANCLFALFYNLHYDALLSVSNTKKIKFVTFITSVIILACYLSLTAFWDMMEPLRSIIGLTILGTTIYISKKEKPKIAAIITSYIINYSVWYVSLLIIALATLSIDLDAELIYFLNIVLSLVTHILLHRLIKRRNGAKHLREPEIQGVYLCASVIVLLIHTFVRMIMSTEHYEQPINVFMFCILFAAISWLTFNIFYLFKQRQKRKKGVDEKRSLQVENRDLMAKGEVKDEIIEQLKKMKEDLDATVHTMAKVTPTYMRAFEVSFAKLFDGLSPEEVKEVTAELSDTIKELKNLFLSEKSSDIKTHQQRIILPTTSWSGLTELFKGWKERSIKNGVELTLHNIDDVGVLDDAKAQFDVLKIAADHVDNSFRQIAKSNTQNGVIHFWTKQTAGAFEIRIDDSASEFSLDVLSKIGERGNTTDGSGFGFSNTLETLAKYDASLIIWEFAPEAECICNKAIIFRFDGQRQLKIRSYRADEVRAVMKSKDVIVEYHKKRIDISAEKQLKNLDLAFESVGS